MMEDPLFENTCGFVLASALLNEHDFKSNGHLYHPSSLYLWGSFLNYPAFKTMPQIKALSIKRLDLMNVLFSGTFLSA